MAELIGRAAAITGFVAFAAALILGPIVTPQGTARPAWHGPRRLPAPLPPPPMRQNVVRDVLGAWVPAAHPLAPACIYDGMVSQA